MNDVTSKLNEWNREKQNIQRQGNLPTFNEREIWWCSIGMNIGYELYGKDKKFWRPVLVLDKHNTHTFFGLPLGSTTKKGRHYHRIDFNNRPGSILLSQGRTFSSLRLSNIMGTISEEKFKHVKDAFKASF